MGQASRSDAPASRGGRVVAVLVALAAMGFGALVALTALTLLAMSGANAEPGWAALLENLLLTLLIGTAAGALGAMVQLLRGRTRAAAWIGAAPAALGAGCVAIAIAAEPPQIADHSGRWRVPTPEAQGGAPEPRP